MFAAFNGARRPDRARTTGKKPMKAVLALERRHPDQPSHKLTRRPWRHIDRTTLSTLWADYSAHVILVTTTLAHFFFLMAL